MPLSNNLKRTASILIKVIILVVAFAFIYNKLANNENLSNFRGIIEHIQGPGVILISLLIFALMFVNWFLEALKWQFLVKTIEEISFFKAVESVFCGLTLAIITPNRIGEYGGRVFFLPPRKRLRGLVAMGVGNIAQLFLTDILGGLSLIWFLARFIPLNTPAYYGITFLILSICCLLLFCYFNIRVLNLFFRRIRFLKPFHKFFIVLSYYRKPELLRVLLFSVFRFCVFTLQYYLVIHLFIPELPFYEIVLMMFIIFFVQASIPSFNLLDVGVRGMTATYFFGYITGHDIAIMASSGFIWLVNLIVPAILGAGFVFKLKFFDVPAR